MKLKQHQKYLEELLANETDRLQKLHTIVEQSIKEEELLTESLSEQTEKEKMKLGDRISYVVARFVGSWGFVISFCLIFGSWIVLNSISSFTNIHFDPFPFDIVKFTLSIIAALQAPLIMMTQNRQAAKERRRNENQYLLNLKAEIELRHLHQKIDLLMKEQIKNLLEVQKVQLDLIEKLYVKLDKLIETKK
jgi:uncharacterized membrane protein